MKINYRKFIYNLAFVGVLVGATHCSDEDYIDANTDPDILNSVPPESQFLSAARQVSEHDREYFYDFYQRIMPWMQYITPVGGNAANFTSNAGNFANRYDKLYIGVGNALTDAEETVKRMPEEEQGQYVHMLAIVRILKAYYAFYTSDIYGSIPYANAWQARYGGTQTPTYDKQQDLFPQLDAEFEQSVATLKTTPGSQVSLDKFDPYFKGSVKAWIRVGNALRLRLATRLLKRNEARALEIITEVLGDSPDNLMSDNTHSWVYRANAAITSGVNWDPNLLFGTQPIIDFMWEKKDPRIDAFYAKNPYSQVNIDSMIVQGTLDEGTEEEDRRYFGSFTSPDIAQSPSVKKAYYTTRTVSVEGRNLRVDTISMIQRRLFQPSFDEQDGEGVGTGIVNMPLFTYAEFCFLRADLAARGFSGDDAATYYTAGVRASVEWYDLIAREAGIASYVPLEENEVDLYLEKPEIAFDPAIAQDQIASQAYLNFFKQPAEGWAWWKRTGLPNTSSVVSLTDMTTTGTSLRIPRRAPLPLPSTVSANYQNQQAAYDAMMAEAGFGSSITDTFGRVWWDQ